VDRHGLLSPRDDKAVVWCVVFVIAKKERSEGRGNPSVIEDASGRVVCSFIEGQWIATGYALTMKNKDVLADDK
jgi:hypothetical protein